MLTKVQVYSSLPGLPLLTLDGSGSPENDFVQVLNVDGLEPTKAAINLLSYGSIDGDAVLGTNVPSRTIVMTLRPNPDWTTWTFETLRQLLYSYFMTKNEVNLVFDSDEVGDVQIAGVVEDIGANSFSKNPEYIVTIVCPDPFFTAITSETVSGTAVRLGGTLEDIANDGNIPSGIRLRMDLGSGEPDASSIRVQFGGLGTSYFDVDARVASDVYFDMNSIPLHKAVREVGTANGIIYNKLQGVHLDAQWPVIMPGDNKFGVITDAGDHEWELEYFKRYGGV